MDKKQAERKGEGRREEERRKRSAFETGVKRAYRRDNNVGSCRKLKICSSQTGCGGIPEHQRGKEEVKE